MYNVLSIKYLKKLLISLTILSTLYLVLGTHKTHAQSFDIGIYPPIIQIKTTPPLSVKAPFQIKNFSDQTITLNLSIHPFSSSTNNDGTINILWNKKITGDDPNIVNEIQLLDDQENSITQLVLAPKQSRKMFIHVGLPKDEPSSDYYFTVLFVSNSITNTQSTSSFLNGGIGMNVLLSVGPYKTPVGFLEKFSTPFIIFNSPVPIQILVKNTNSFFITPHGNLIIYNMFNQIVGKLNLLPVNILANNSRFIPDDKSGSLINAVWNEKAIFGIYKVRLSLLLTPKGPLIQKNIYFLALPWQAILGIIILCGLSSIIILNIREKLKKN